MVLDHMELTSERMKILPYSVSPTVVLTLLGVKDVCLWTAMPLQKLISM